MNTKFIALGVAIIASLLLVTNCLFIITETQKAVMLKFGKLVEGEIEPGLHFKLPFIHQVRKFDSRLLTSDARPQRYLTKEKKALIVDSYAKWRISDVKLFYKTTSGDINRALHLLYSRIDTGLRNQFGERTLHEVVSGERDQLMTELTTDLNNVAQKELGIEVLDIRVKGIELPPQASESVFERMRTERERTAKELRSQGKELAEGIKADADRQVTIITSNAYKTAQEIKGRADAKATAIYAAAFNRDSKFYQFYRSLSAYKKTFASKDDLMIIEPTSEFFKYLNKGYK